MKPEVSVQYACSDRDRLPTETQLTCWVHAAVCDLPRPMELTIRIVDENEAAELNLAWRQKSGATNVLSFPLHDDLAGNTPLLGDLVICAPVVANEAMQQNKTLESHWAHLVIHGSLHLLGYDHINKTDAIEMESLETTIMASLGHSDPYK